ncbi:MAG: YbdK family carboxylate-amine ligase [Actinomycetota bacterium]|nr:YbdK family carboxylate-amine ligase [Actinomycetota bacterium]
MTEQGRDRPDWSAWQTSRPFTLGIEEEAMLLDAEEWSLRQEGQRVWGELSPDLAERTACETHGSALELATGVHETVESATRELAELRTALARELEPMGLRPASAGTHPSTSWQETVVSTGERYAVIYGSMRELARREPTFSLHVHVGVTDEEAAIRLANRLRGHVPLLLALSANSPFWQGRDTGLASARTPVWKAFPRIGIPRAFRDYDEYVEAIDLLVRCEAFPDPTFLWWDVRPQPRFGTVEVRVMDAQTTVEQTVALVALIQSIARLELEEGWIAPALLDHPEILEENRFIACRDGAQARLVEPEPERRVPVREQVDALVDACRPHAEALGCEDELAGAPGLADHNGAVHQRELVGSGESLEGLVARLAEAFPPAQPAVSVADGE